MISVIQNNKCVKVELIKINDHETEFLLSFKGTNKQTNNPTCSYSSESQSLKIANTNNLALKSLKIFDATGKLWISESMEQEICTETELDASMLSKGFYLVVVQPYDENFPTKTFKIQIK